MAWGEQTEVRRHSGIWPLVGLAAAFWGCPNDEDRVDVSSGTNFTCGLQRSGRLRCWGLDYAPPEVGGYGQVTDAPVSRDFQVVIAGSRHACSIVSSAGAVTCTDKRHRPAGETPYRTPPDGERSEEPDIAAEAREIIARLPREDDPADGARSWSSNITSDDLNSILHP